MNSLAHDDPLATPIRSLVRRLANVHVPRGDTLIFFRLAAAVLLLLVNEAATGIVLALYYTPTISNANESVRYVITDVEYGGLVRSLHFWGAQGLILFLGAGIAFALVRRAYKAPNGVTWMVGIALTFIVVAETVTGGLLPWTQRSAVEGQISSTLASRVPLLGPWLRSVMLGGNGTSDLALVRVLGVHAGALPMLASACVLLLGLHAAGSVPHAPREDTMPFAPHVALRMAVAAALCEMLLLAVSALRSPWLGARAGAAHTDYAGVRPRWFLVFLDDILRNAPPRMLGIPSTTVISATLSLFALVAALFPLADRKGSRVGQVLGLAVAAAIIGGTIRALVA